MIGGKHLLLGLPAHRLYPKLSRTRPDRTINGHYLPKRGVPKFRFADYLGFGTSYRRLLLPKEGP